MEESKTRAGAGSLFAQHCGNLTRNALFLILDVRNNNSNLLGHDRFL